MRKITLKRIVVDYMPPSICDITEQNAILEKAARTFPSGIAIDPVDTVDNMTAINSIIDQAIPVVLFDSPSPNAIFTSIGNSYSEQGIIAAEHWRSSCNERISYSTKPQRTL